MEEEPTTEPYWEEEEYAAYCHDEWMDRVLERIESIHSSRRGL